MAKRPGNNPCKDCDRRTEGCHTRCEDGKRWEEEQRAYRDTVLQGRRAERDAESATVRRSTAMRNIMQRIPKAGGYK